MTATKTPTAHSNCTHDSTKAARALCRKNRAAGIQTVTTDYGTFEIKTIKAKDLKKTDAVLFRPETAAPFFSFPTYDAFQTESVNRTTQSVEKTDTYNVTIGSRSFVPGDTAYVVAVDPKSVKAAQHQHTRGLHAALRNIAKH